MAPSQQPLEPQSFPNLPLMKLTPIAKPTAIYETSELPSFDLTEAQLQAIYSLEVTPAGATAPMALGDVLANCIDQAIANTGVTGAINTPGVTLPTVTAS